MHKINNCSVTVPKKLITKLRSTDTEQLNTMLKRVLANVTPTYTIAKPSSGLSRLVIIGLDDETKALLEQKARLCKHRQNDLLAKACIHVFSKSGMEAFWQERLHNKLGGKREVHVPCGRIDLLTSDAIIEVKVARQWKHALGQVLAYKAYKPKYEAKLALIGKLPSTAKGVAEYVCNQYGVSILWLY